MFPACGDRNQKNKDATAFSVALLGCIGRLALLLMDVNDNINKYK